MYIRRNGHLHLHLLGLHLQNVATSCAILVDEVQVFASYTKALPVP